VWSGTDRGTAVSDTWHITAIAWTDQGLITSLRFERTPNNCMSNDEAYSIEHTVYSIQYPAHSIQYPEHSIKYTAYSIQHTAYSVQNTAYSIQHTVYSISTHCTIRTKLLNNGERNSPFSAV